jgi:hypothetical protein
MDFTLLGALMYVFLFCCFVLHYYLWLEVWDYHIYCQWFKIFILSEVQSETEEAKGHYYNMHLLFGGIGSLRAISVV